MILAAKDQGYSCVEAVATKFTSRANDIGFWRKFLKSWTKNVRLTSRFLIV
jgi:hypothetical protein